MMTLFYILAILFGWTEYYHMIHKHRLYDRRQDKSLVDRFFFLSKLFYAIWIVLGLFTHFWLYFTILLIIGQIRYPVMWFGNSRVLFFYEMLNTPASVMLLMVIFGFGLF